MLPIRRSAIPFCMFPKTFQDAITVTRQLEVRYLWIDCFCVIQDGQSDWQTQATKMCDVYSEAYLTLATANSPDCDGGLFSALSSQYKIIEIASMTQGDSQYKVYARRFRDISHRWDSRSYTTFRATPLFERGWTYQERLLSPRLLLFTPWELQWGCFEAFACECSCSTVFFNASTTRLPPFTESLPGEFIKMKFRRQLECSSARLWTEVIDKYYRLRFTTDLINSQLLLELQNESVKRGRMRDIVQASGRIL